MLLWGILLVCGLVYYGMHKMKEAGIDPALMKSNPGLAAAKMAAAVNPNLEVLSTNDSKGLITVKDKTTGKVSTMKFDMENKKLVVTDENGKEVEFSATGDAATGSLEVKSSEGSMKFGAAAGNKAPAWVPVYPGSSPEGTFAAQTGEGSTSSFTFKTQDPSSKVLAYYQDALKSGGFTMTNTLNSSDSSGTGGMITAEDAGKKRTIVVTLGTSSGSTQVSVMATEKK